VTLAIFGYLFSRTDLDKFAASAGRVSPLAFVGCFVGLAAAYSINLIRWRILLYAYGATRLPSWPKAARLFLISAFYNLLPGAVGGDVLRGYATRGCFAGGEAARSLSVVLVERVLGLAGLVALTASVAVKSPLGGDLVLFYSGLGLAAALSAILGLVLGRRFAGVLPGKLGQLAGSLPGIEVPRAFLLAASISVLTHVSIALGAHAIVHDLAPAVSLSDSLIIIPLGTLAAYFPATVAGAGARDTALGILFGQVGVPVADALTVSLSLLGCQLLISAVGGLLQAFGHSSAD
jgi:uncharacterized membrane protein YbhN (UPF0104 family)